MCHKTKVGKKKSLAEGVKMQLLGSHDVVSCFFVIPGLAAAQQQSGRKLRFASTTLAAIEEIQIKVLSLS